MNEYEFLDDINFDDFVNKLDQLEIRVDIDTSERLFKALTLENSSKLDRLTFEIFIDVYQSKEAELKKINRFLPINKLRTIEFSLKVSPYSVVPNYGIGISVLTQKCLYFLEQGTNKRKVLTELKDIISIEKTQYSKGFFQSKPALKITTISQVVYISPDGEVSVWYLLLNELCSSFRIANETKDSSLIQYAAINVLLLDSLIQSGLNSTTNHSEDLERSIKYLSFYTFYKSDSTRLQMSTDAKKILHLRINPSSREYTSQSVESMIYVDIERYPTVWCAIGNRIKIFDAITWNDEIMDIKLETKITCLLHEPLNSKVWISTLDKYFYVMDVLTRSFIRRIQDHTDVIINISLFKKIDKVITASSNGEILVWDPEKIEKKDTANLNELFQNKSKLAEVTTSRNYLILTSSSSIEILDEKLQYKETIKFKIGETYEKISCTCVSYDKDSDDEFLWVGNSTNGIVTVWNLNRFELVMRIGVEECNGYRSFLCVDDFIWAGSKDGRLMLFSSKYYECEKSFKAHKDTVRSLCFVEYNKFVISGAGSRDGSIAVWRSSIINRKTIAGSIGKMLSPENK
ncbi:unnamed protein product [Brachionus calyciflorus]|uniref:Uncharacterized protein n=1 Tax=Brachionus calyciflorus TaxID=104777 RepID=A0A813NKY1_9BILA|nr:unnamed protein product [Brachionus calyciflorus]